MSQTWTVACNGCGADLARVNANHEMLTDSRETWLKVTVCRAEQPREEYDPSDFCSWACLAAYAEAQRCPA